MRLIDAPIGLFKHGNCIALKTEYMNNGTVEAYIVSSGEYFWGGAKTAEELNNLEVTPIKLKDLVPRQLRSEDEERRDCMKIVIVEPFKEPYVSDIDGSLSSMQKIVGGYIEVLYPFKDNAALVCNEEGKLKQLPFNRVVFYDDPKMSYEIIAGTFFICGIDYYNGEFNSLTDEQVERFIQGLPV